MGGRVPAAEGGRPAAPACHAACLSLRANLLRLATLTPDIGAEWRVGAGWGVLVDGGWTSWSWDGKRGRYALWEVSPQARRYLGPGRCGYVGAMFKTGSFNHKPGRRSRQGDIIGGGFLGARPCRLRQEHRNPRP